MYAGDDDGLEEDEEVICRIESQTCLLPSAHIPEHKAIDEFWKSICSTVKISANLNLLSNNVRTYIIFTFLSTRNTWYGTDMIVAEGTSGAKIGAIFHL